MVVKNFAFREKWVGSEVDGIKIAFSFAIFDQTWTLILAPKPQVWNFLKNFLERQKLHNYKLCDAKTD